MNWRRGLLLASIHFVIAGSLVSLEEFRSYRYEKHTQASTNVVLKPVVFEEETVTFDPCNGGFVDGVSPGERIVQFTNLPVWSLVQWRNPCPARWTIAGMLRANSHLKLWEEDVALGIILCVLIPIQWLFVGGTSPVRPRRWWMEPDALITICAVTSAAVTIPFLLFDWPDPDFIATLPMLIVLFAWLWWLCLIAWGAFKAITARIKLRASAI